MIFPSFRESAPTTSTSAGRANIDAAITVWVTTDSCHCALSRAQTTLPLPSFPKTLDFSYPHQYKYVYSALTCSWTFGRPCNEWEAYRPRETLELYTASFSRKPQKLHELGKTTVLEVSKNTVKYFRSSRRYLARKGITGTYRGVLLQICMRPKGVRGGLEN